MAKERGVVTKTKAELDAFGDALVGELSPPIFLEKVLEHITGNVSAPVLLFDDIYHRGVLAAIDDRLDDAITVVVTLPGLGLLRWLGIGAAAEDGPLDQEAVELIKDLKPAVKIHGARDKSDIPRRAAELSKRLGLEPVPALT
jgi:hypothetical protein